MYHEGSLLEQAIIGCSGIGTVCKDRRWSPRPPHSLAIARPHSSSRLQIMGIRPSRQHILTDGYGANWGKGASAATFNSDVAADVSADRS